MIWRRSSVGKQTSAMLVLSVLFAFGPYLADDPGRARAAASVDQSSRFKFAEG
jgi:hypothetical protein